MNQTDEVDPTNQPVFPEEMVSPRTLNTLFAQLNPGDVEQFHKSYQAWMLQHQRAALLTQIAIVQQKVMENAEHMQRLAPSALALASLTQLRSYGVEDIDLLERMLERGEAWLDHAIQLLEHCERLGVIGGSYGEWCEHALEGAYDWIASIERDSDQTDAVLADREQNGADPADTAQITEEIILQRLMSDNEEEHETEKVSAVHIAAMTQPLSIQNRQSSDDGSIEVQDSLQRWEDASLAEVEPLGDAETANQVHDVEDVEEEPKVEDAEKSVEEHIVMPPPVELQPDLVTNDQGNSSSFDGESREASSDVPVTQPLTELSFDDAQLKGLTSISMDHLWEEDASSEAGVIKDQAQALQVESSISGGNFEQVGLAVSSELEPGKEKDFEARNENDQAELLQANGPVSDEVIRVGLTGQAQQQVTEPELAGDRQLSLADYEQQAAISQETQREEKPQRKALPSKRGFLRRSLAKIWHW